MTRYLRAFAERAADMATAEPGTPIRFIASTENVARDGLVIEAAGWDLENFQRNPVFLWAHDMMGARPPIGKVDASVKGKRLMADVTFDQGDEFARAIESKYRNGFLNAVSVSWDTREYAPPKAQGAAPRVTKAELLEISGVPVPSDPGALAQRQARALRDLASELEQLAPADPSDDPPAPDTRPLAGSHIPVTKTMIEDAAPGATEDAWEDAAAAMCRLYLPGMRMTERERRREYHRLAKQYRLASRECPEWIALDDLASFTARELRGLFLEGEPDLFPELFRSTAGQRAGAVLSKRNRDDIEQAIGLLTGVLRRAEKEAEQAASEADEDAERGMDDDPILAALNQALLPTV